MGSAEKRAEILRIRAKCEEVYIFERIILPTALYGAEAWGMRCAEMESECS